MQSTFEAVERVFIKFNIDYYLIGAFARDMWLDHLDLPNRRATLDIDFCIYINDQNQFESLKDYLVSIEGFSKDIEPYRLYAPNQNIIDLIPFGGIEKNGIVELGGSNPISLSVFGNTTVLSHAEVLEVNQIPFKICTLPGLCILKLISGAEKPERFLKDMGDFYYILENYFEIAGETIFDNRHDDLIEADFQPDLAAAKLLGRQLLIILSDSQTLKVTVIRILRKLLNGFTDSDI